MVKSVDAAGSDGADHAAQLASLIVSGSGKNTNSTAVSPVEFEWRGHYVPCSSPCLHTYMKTVNLFSVATYTTPRSCTLRPTA